MYKTEMMKRKVLSKGKKTSGMKKEQAEQKKLLPNQIQNLSKGRSKLSSRN